jgi:hypothetical protein
MVLKLNTLTSIALNISRSLFIFVFIYFIFLITKMSFKDNISKHIDNSRVTPCYKCVQDEESHIIQFANAGSNGAPPNGYSRIEDVTSHDGVSTLKIQNAYISDGKLKMFIERFSSNRELELKLLNCTVYQDKFNEEELPVTQNYCNQVTKLFICGNFTKFFLPQLFSLRSSESITELFLDIAICSVNRMNATLSIVFAFKSLKTAHVCFHEWDNDRDITLPRPLIYNNVSDNDTIKTFSLVNKSTKGQPLLQLFLDNLIANKKITNLDIKGFYLLDDGPAPLIGLLRNTSLKVLTLNPFISRLHEKKEEYIETLQCDVLGAILQNHTLNELVYDIVTEAGQNKCDEYTKAIRRFMDSDYSDVPYRNTNYHFLVVFENYEVDAVALGFYDKLFENKYGRGYDTDTTRIFALAHGTSHRNVRSPVNSAHSSILQNIAGMLMKPDGQTEQLSTWGLFSDWAGKHDLNPDNHVTFKIPGKFMYPPKSELIKFHVGDMADLRIFKCYMKNNTIDVKHITVSQSDEGEVEDASVNNKWRKALLADDVDPLPMSVFRDRVYLKLLKFYNN